MLVFRIAAGVEEAVVICPFLTPEYQASRSCKKELSYADTREVIIVPVMLAKSWEASEWLGLITAGLLWVDFRWGAVSMWRRWPIKKIGRRSDDGIVCVKYRNADKNEENFEMCVRSLEEEIMFSAGHLLDLEEPKLRYTLTGSYIILTAPLPLFTHLPYWLAWPLFVVFS